MSVSTSPRDSWKSGVQSAFTFQGLRPVHPLNLPGLPMLQAQGSSQLIGGIIIATATSTPCTHAQADHSQVWPPVAGGQPPPQWQKIYSLSARPGPPCVKRELKQFCKSWQLGCLPSFSVFQFPSLLWVPGLLTQPLGREAANGTWFRGSRMGWEGSNYIASFLQNILLYPTTPLPGLLWLMEPASFKAIFFATFWVVFIQWYYWAPVTGMHCSGTQVSCCLTNII